MIQAKRKVLVLDMQPIDPPVGGGRLRLLGLYHNLGENIETQYIGTYDWPGEKFRDHKLSASLREVNIPLSNEHFNECQKWQEKVAGKTIIDTTFSSLARLSPEYVSYVRNEVVNAEVVVFSHPWIYPIVKDLLNTVSQLVIYDSQNVEGYLRFTLLDDGAFGTEIVRNVVTTEYELCHLADFVLACSYEDCGLFNKLYRVPFGKLKVVPNGVFTEQIHPVSDEDKLILKKKLGLKLNRSAIFIGSNYPPNLEACNFILKDLAPTLTDVNFVIAGGVGEGLSTGSSSNVLITGRLSEVSKIAYLTASDLAINPMFSGSGTNIKMFDFMAAGLPILSTLTGARGIDIGTADVIEICDQSNFIEKFKALLTDSSRLLDMSKSSRRIAEDKYSWEKISSNLGLLISRNVDEMGKKEPVFSVVIPTYNRHEKLNSLMKSISSQKFHNFEVIIVDQSEDKWDPPDLIKEINLLYIHSEIKGAVIARNTGAFFARGKVLVFTDDDCIPNEDWLNCARNKFEKENIIGIEGLIRSDKLGDPNYRHVTNEGFGGMGFMTANLFLLREVFNRIGGFDERFDRPHFREDTDLAWRALEYGSIPYSKEVCVIHPAHPRSVERESLTVRNTFFEKDALLLQKHPSKYMRLFFCEDHWKKTDGFWENFFLGIKKYQVNIKDHEILKYVPEQYKRELTSRTKT